jgi:hypothetical protein
MVYLLLNLGYDISSYGACLNLFIEMYGWEGNNKGYLNVYWLVLWSVIPTILTLIGAFVICTISNFFVVICITLRCSEEENSLCMQRVCLVLYRHSLYFKLKKVDVYNTLARQEQEFSINIFLYRKIYSRVIYGTLCYCNLILQ